MRNIHSRGSGQGIGVDAGQVKRMLADRAEAVCQWLLPNGRRDGSEWRVGSIDGEVGKSLAVHLSGDKAGVWQDFATGLGGDLIDLVASVRGTRFPDALREAKDFLGVRDEHPGVKAAARKTFVRPARPNGLRNPGSEMRRYLNGRGISDETIANAQVGETDGRDGPMMIFPYKLPLDEGGDVLHLKHRAVRDKRTMFSSRDSERILFGWHTVPLDSREVVIVEGEIDQLSFLEKGVPALSVPNGGGGKGKQDCWLESDFERLQRFATIYLALDNDGPGKEATEYVIDRLGRHRCRIVRFPDGVKDANDALKAGVDLKALLADARGADPAQMVAAESLVEEALDILSVGIEQTGERVTWGTFDGNVFLSPGETSVWAGVNGHGKSQLLQQLAIESIAGGHRWMIASMEFLPRMLMSRMIRQMTGSACPEGAAGDIAEFVRDRLWLFDASTDVDGNAGADSLLEIFEYAFRAHGIDHFVIDSLAKIGLAEDDYAGQQSFVRRLSNFDRRLGVHTHLVVHVKKLMDEGCVPDKFDLKGSGSVSDLVDNVFIVWRNKGRELGLDDADEGDAVLRCVKQRFNGWEGGARLWFDRPSLQYGDRENFQPTDYTARRHELGV